MKLTPKQKLFCDNYLISLNAKEAAILAGYSANSAGEIGHENLKKPHLRLYIDERMREKDNERIASQDEVLELLTKFARGEEVEEVVATYKDRSEIIPKKIVPRDRLKAAELLGKRYALFTDKQDVSADVGININVDYGDEDES